MKYTANSINNSAWDMLIMLVFGVLGYLMKKYEYPAAPLIMALVIGPMFEVSLGQSLTMSSGNFLIFLSRPITAFFMSIVIILLISPAFLNRFGKKRPGLIVRDQDE